MFDAVILRLAVVAEAVVAVFGVFFQQVFEPVPGIDAMVAVGVNEMSGVAVGGVMGDDDDRGIGGPPAKVLFPSRSGLQNRARW